MPVGDPTNGVSKFHLLVRCREGVGVPDRDLALPGSVLVDGLLNADALGCQGVDRLEHQVIGLVMPDGVVDGGVSRRVERRVPAVQLGGQVVLVLKGGPHRDAQPCGTVQHALQE